MDTCRKGEHDLTDPENVIVRRWRGREDRVCGPCFREYQAAYRRRRRREAGVPERPRSTPEQRREERERFLELVAEGQPHSVAALTVGHSQEWGSRVARQAGVTSPHVSGSGAGPKAALRPS